MGRRVIAGAAALLMGLLLVGPAYAAERESLVPLGRTVGLELETEGVYIVGFEADETPSPAEAAGLRVGDRILAAAGRGLDRAETLRVLVEAAQGPVVLDVDRAGRALQVAVQPELREGVPRLGIRVRDRIAGLGTLTFYDPETGLFGALGHGVSGGGDCPMVIRGGQAAETAVTGIRRGEAGSPGSLVGPAVGGETLGRVEQNTDRGLFGAGAAEALTGETVPLADPAEVRLGPAELWCDLEGGELQHYAVEIEAARWDEERCRDLRIRVTDPRLLELTGGIVQGMSGSPILQDGKLVGAVTHVLINDPTRGYGILIDHMLDAVDQAAEAA